MDTEITIDNSARGNDVATLKTLLRRTDTCVNVNENDNESRNTALHTAATKGNLEAAQLLIEAGADIRQKNYRGFTPAHTAASYGRLNVLKLFLICDRELLNLTDLNGNTLLNIAAAKGHVIVVEYLLKQKAELNIRNKNGESGFHSAAKGKRLKVLQTLIKYEEESINDVNKEGNTPLHIATSKGYDEIIELLLSCGAKYSKMNKSGKTPMQMASPKTAKVFRKFKDYRDIVARCLSGMTPLLISKRFDDDNTALHIVSSFSGQPKVLKMLVSSGANVNSHNCYNQTPLYIAVLTENIVNVKTLVSLGGKVDDPEYERGQTALHVASLKHDLEILKVLTRRNSIDVNVVDKDGKTPLAYAVVHQSRAAVQHLLERGADASLKDQHGQTALHLSVLTKNADITEDLLSVVNQTAVNEKNVDGQSPLIFAVDRKSKNYDNNTAKLIDILIRNGADPFQKNNGGESAYSLATEKGIDITKRLNDKL